MAAQRAHTQTSKPQSKQQMTGEAPDAQLLLMCRWRASLANTSYSLCAEFLNPRTVRPSLTCVTFPRYLCSSRDSSCVWFSQPSSARSPKTWNSAPAARSQAIELF